MMRLFPRQRLRLALFLCPTLRAFNGPEAARALDLLCDWLQFGVPAFGFFDANIAKQSVVNRRNNGTDFADHIIEKQSGANLPFSDSGGALLLCQKERPFDIPHAIVAGADNV